MIQILNWKTGEVIFEGDYPNIKGAVEAAVKQGVSLEGADLAEADLTDINLTGVNLIGVNFYMANLTRANFRGATITRANFYNAILVGADFTSANLSDTNLSEANLAWANLRGANFRDSTLSGANLYMTILTDTDITDTNLEELKFERVILTDLKFERVILTDTKPKKTIEYKTVKVIDCDDWDNLVRVTYGKPYNLQQQDGCMERQRMKITVPLDGLDDFKNDILEESEYDMGVSFKAWLEKDPNEISDSFQRELFWERKFYPSLDMVINDLYERGLLEAGEYEIDIDW